MRVYRNSVYVTGAITVLSFAGALLLNYCFPMVNAFWCNLLLGVFGSGLLTFISSIIGYRVERKKTFEGFWTHTIRLIGELEKYQHSWTVDKKVDFLLAYHEISKIDWQNWFGEFSFLFDFRGKTRKFIYSEIYEPLQEFHDAVSFRVWNFRWHKDGSAYNETVMSMYVQEIESKLLDITHVTLPKEYGGSVTMESATNKLTSYVMSALKGKYYSMMYGKRIDGK